MLDLIATVTTDLLRPLQTSRGLATAIFSVLGLGAVVAASFVRTMVPLRSLTVFSNAMLLVSALCAPNPASAMLFLILLPLNAWRLREIVFLTRLVTAASVQGDLSGTWLKPYMQSTRLPAGTVLFRRGDPADKIYLLLAGDLRLVEIGKSQPLNQLFGEISFFSPDRARTLTAECHSECLVLNMEEAAFKQLYFQNPKFAFEVSSLIAQRLDADIQRLQARNDELQKHGPEAKHA